MPLETSKNSLPALGEYPGIPVNGGYLFVAAALELLLQGSFSRFV
jgi:hypothetical protein